MIVKNFSLSSHLSFIKDKLEEYNQKYWHNKLPIIVRDSGLLQRGSIGTKFISNNEWYGTFLNFNELNDQNYISILKCSYKMFYNVFNKEILGIKSLTHKLKKVRKKR